MTRISLELDKALNHRLKQYCLNEFPDHPFGQQQSVLRNALTAYLDAHEKGQPQAAPKVAYGMLHDGEKPEKPKAGTKVKPIDDPEKVALMTQMLKDGHIVPEIMRKTGIPASTIRSRAKAMKKKGELLL